jgi:DnaK suppressor protein
MNDVSNYVAGVKVPTFDASFLKQQREQLVKLRTSLLVAAQMDEDDEADLQRESAGGPREYEDDAQRLANLEIDGNLVARSLDRLTRVERALTKLDEGTYGVSDVSGEPIPRERLEAAPEAICTLDEESALERGGSARN